ncbi:unnamed protein product, partial [Symbiodinium microadriaticum]
ASLANSALSMYRLRNMVRRSFATVCVVALVDFHAFVGMKTHVRRYKLQSRNAACVDRFGAMAQSVLNVNGYDANVTRVAVELAQREAEAELAKREAATEVYLLHDLGAHYSRKLGIVAEPLDLSRALADLMKPVINALFHVSQPRRVATSFQPPSRGNAVSLECSWGVLVWQRAGFASWSEQPVHESRSLFQLKFEAERPSRRSVPGTLEMSTAVKKTLHDVRSQLVSGKSLRGLPLTEEKKEELKIKEQQLLHRQRQVRLQRQRQRDFIQSTVSSEGSRVMAHVDASNATQTQEICHAVEAKGDANLAKGDAILGAIDNKMTPEEKREADDRKAEEKKRKADEKKREMEEKKKRKAEEKKQRDEERAAKKAKVDAEKKELAEARKDLKACSQREKKTEGGAEESTAIPQHAGEEVSSTTGLADVAEVEGCEEKPDEQGSPDSSVIPSTWIPKLGLFGPKQ